LGLTAFPAANNFLTELSLDITRYGHKGSKAQRIYEGQYPFIPYLFFPTFLLSFVGAGFPGDLFHIQPASVPGLRLRVYR